MRKILRAALLATLSGGIWSTAAMAQTDSVSSLMALDVSGLRGEIRNRYDAALALTLDAAVVSTDDNRFMWASEAKAQCGIALGFLKSSTKDAVSIGKCDDAYNRMQVKPPVVVPEPPKLPDNCATPIVGIVFFDWDSDVPPEGAMANLDAVVHYSQTCKWNGLVVTGHTDLSGSNKYNDALSLRRAQAVAALLGTKGIPPSLLSVAGHGEDEPKVPTPDGERNPQNRRVEIYVK